MKYKEVYERAAARLQQAGVEEAALDARLLLEEACGTDRNTLLAHPDRMLSEEERTSFEKMVSAREKRIPLQQITGYCDFMGLRFYVNQDVLIPRQDTENLVEEAMRYLHDGMRILDVCTGSGCILLSLLRYSNGCKGIGIDLSDEALSVARKNAEALELSGQASFFQGDLFAALVSAGREEKFELLVSNPPYIRSDVIETLMPEVKDHEPRMALDGDADGLIFYRRICREALPYLCGGARIVFEIGYDQAADVSGIMEEAGYRGIETIKDYAGNDRIVTGVYFG
ncbi:MAG: peptide chain release factor N(5)-glutamine methyltransferase [Lachnospiraceae bacterium]|jgi:release factor glutamine methyltransferase|nr:peptide chain release factor N(5)-glutamine methyltransferase [Lachnospiraceae bacterium]